MRDVNRVYNFLKRLPIEIKQLQKRLDNLERSNKEMEPKLDNVILSFAVAKNKSKIDFLFLTPKLFLGCQKA
jgi:hypothetical protein